MAQQVVQRQVSPRRRHGDERARPVGQPYGAIRGQHPHDGRDRNPLGGSPDCDGQRQVHAADRAAVHQALRRAGISANE